MAIEVKNMQQWQKAIERAKIEKPLIRFVKLGEYQVRSTSDKTIWYTVTFEKVDGARIAHCTHHEQQNRKREYPCVHAAACLGSHIMKAREAAQAAPTGDDLAAHVAECDDPECGHSPVNGPISDTPENPYYAPRPEPVKVAPTLTERIARDRANIADLRKHYLPGPVIPTFASREEAMAVAASANADLFG